MNILLWILQVLLAVHTAAGAVWKFSNPPRAVPSLSAIPSGVWTGMSVVELLCCIGLVLPAFYRPSAKAAPVAAIVIAAEMLMLSAVHLRSGDPNYGPMVYWLVVAAVCAFIAYGRLKLKPL